MGAAPVVDDEEGKREERGLKIRSGELVKESFSDGTDPLTDAVDVVRVESDAAVDPVVEFDDVLPDNLSDSGSGCCW